MIVIAFHAGNAFNFVKGIVFPMPFPNHRIHFRMHARIRHQDSCFLAVVLGIVHGEYTVDFSLFQCLQREFCTGERNRFKRQLCVFHAGRSHVQIILQGSLQLSRYRIFSAVGKIVHTISNPDYSVMSQPFVLRGREVCSEITAVEIFLVHLLVIIPVFVLDAVHSGIQFFQQIRTVFVHRKVKRGGTHLAKRNRLVCFGSLLNGACAYIKIDGTADQPMQCVIFSSRKLYNVGLNAAFFCPCNIVIFLHTALVYTCPFSIEGCIVIRADGLVAA